MKENNKAKFEQAQSLLGELDQKGKNLQDDLNAQKERLNKLKDEVGKIITSGAANGDPVLGQKLLAFEKEIKNAERLIAQKEKDLEKFKAEKDAAAVKFRALN